jgi:hypothetical protein
LRSGHALFSRRRPVPPGYDAVAEALTSRADPVAPCAVVGRELARDGVSLGEALSGLADTHAAVGAGEPSFAATEAIAVAWGETTLEFLHDVTCEDPLTGLASAPHLRARLAEVYRGAAHEGADVRRSHALVVVQVAAPAERSRTGVFARALGLAAVAEVVRDVFAADQTVARVGADRVVALVRRSDDLGRSVATISATLDRVELPERASVWVEGLPGSLGLGVRLLAELAL